MSWSHKLHVQLMYGLCGNLAEVFNVLRLICTIVPSYNDLFWVSKLKTSAC